MDLIRRNTDYALRLAASLACEYNTGKASSARTLSKNNNVPYPLTCKLLQKFQQAGIVTSTMGPKGGFRLTKTPAETTFLELIAAIQGPISVNRCLLGPYACPMSGQCPLHPKLVGLQQDIEGHLKKATLADLSAQNGIKESQLKGQTNE